MRGRGRIGAGATIRSVTEMIDVHVGPAAIVNGATSLVNGSILSCPEAPTLVGPGVQADSFIIAEGARVTGGAMVAKTYVGQGTQVGRQFSAEGSLLFANCEAFHGEACSVFAGPYTVTHHKGSLLIAGLFSFYNAGSGTNQSNHMYKLGPVHEGRVERGSKTGSFSYMMWPCRVGPFCVVLGKHTRAFDTADFPFSHIEALPDGRCSLIPGFNLTTVGTVRDGAKWPTRDRRKGPVKRDRLSFDVFSPYTVGRMLRGMEILHDFQQKTDRSVGSRGDRRRRSQTSLPADRTEVLSPRGLDVSDGEDHRATRTGLAGGPRLVDGRHRLRAGRRVQPAMGRHGRTTDARRATGNAGRGRRKRVARRSGSVQRAARSDPGALCRGRMGVGQMGVSAADRCRSGHGRQHRRSWKWPIRCSPAARNSWKPCWPTPSRSSTDTAPSDSEPMDRPKRSTGISKPCAATTTRTSSSSRCGPKSSNSASAWTQFKQRVAQSAVGRQIIHARTMSQGVIACPISLIA